MLPGNEAHKLSQSCNHIRTEMNPQHAPPAFGQHSEITLRLGSLNHPEAVAMPWYLQVQCMLTGNLQKDAVIGAPLVGLPG